MKRTRRIFGLQAEDIWFEEEAFKNSRSFISILHSPKKVDQKGLITINEKTFLIDLTKPLEDIFSKFDKKSKRYAINKAERDGVTIHLASSAKEREDFYNFFLNFAQMKGIPRIDQEELKEYDIFYALAPGGQYLGGCAFVKSNDKSVYRYKHGATSYQHNENDLLLWKAIQHAKAKGYTTFDFGGVKVVEDQNSDYFRHYKFKEKFGGELADFYSCIKIKQPFFSFTLPFRVGVHIFFKGDYNQVINTLSKRRMLQ